MNTIRWHWCSSLPHLEPSHWLNRNQQIIKVYKLNSQILLNKCLIVLKKETTVPNFKFVSKLTKFSFCWASKKRLDNLSSISTKCPQCETLRRMSECSNKAPIKLCILHKDNELWLTPFRTEILKLLKPNSLHHITP